MTNVTLDPRALFDAPYRFGPSDGILVAHRKVRLLKATMGEEKKVNLIEIARRATAERGFEVYFPSTVGVEIRTAKEPDFATLDVRDMSNLLWSSIDNDESKDLDQIEYSEQYPGGTRIYVGIADVTAFVAKGSATDLFAQKNTTSVYTGAEIFPMLPNKFSTDLTSLNEAKKRLAVVVEMDVDTTGVVSRSTVYQAVVKNQAQLTYGSVSAWLENHPAPTSPEGAASTAKILANKALQEQLLMQDKAAQRLRSKREKAGALDFDSNNGRAKVEPDGSIKFEIQESRRAPEIIEEFMIAANESVDGFLASKNFPCLQRIVRVPKNWPRMVAIAAELGKKLPLEPDSHALQAFLAEELERDPAKFPELSFAMIKLLGRGEYVVKEHNKEGIGHFGLATPNYSHSTAPNRRYPDLITQRLVKAASKSEPVPYSYDELVQIAQHCTRKEDDANRVERQVGKSIIAVSLSDKLGEEWPGIVTGVSEKGTFVHINTPPADGRIIGPDSPRFKALEVANHVTVRLIKADPYRGFLDFELVGP